MLSVGAQFSQSAITFPRSEKLFIMLNADLSTAYRGNIWFREETVSNGGNNEALRRAEQDVRRYTGFNFYATQAIIVTYDDVPTYDSNTALSLVSDLL